MSLPSATTAKPGLLLQLLRDRAGNTLAMIAAALIPLLAMTGGGIDMGRSYLSQSRLQQACDAGVLAARKRLGSQVVTTGIIPSDVADIGNRFFNLNFSDGSYGTQGRSFVMTLEPDYSISGVAAVDVPTTIMTLFGYSQVGVNVECSAKLNFSNTDVMFVLDTTGSMSETNPSDSAPKIDILKQVVKDFHAQIEGSKSPGTRVRYGFVPYSTNVHVAELLKSDWMVDSWAYQSRTPNPPTVQTVSYYYVNYTVLSGGTSPIAAYTASACPGWTKNIAYGPSTTTSTSPHSFWYDTTTTGDEFSCTGNDGSYTVTGTHYDNLVVRETWTFAYNGDYYSYDYHYGPVSYDVRGLKGPTGDDPAHTGTVKANLTGSPYTSTLELWDVQSNGCIEERDTYQIGDYSNVDLSKALDLDIDLVPTASDAATQWRPIIPGLEFERSLRWDGTGAINPAVVDDNDRVLNAEWSGYSACPAQAQKLTEMSASDVANYVNALTPQGDTYHDIGMIWGARLLSPTGLFAAENADLDGKPTSRNLIFLTDGITEPFDVDYGAYGVEPLTGRRWTPSSPYSLKQTVENRFGVACSEAKKRNITVWVIGFGTTLNPIMTQCAGPGHFFEAADAAELSDVFSKIAAQMGDLRIGK